MSTGLRSFLVTLALLAVIALGIVVIVFWPWMWMWIGRVLLGAVVFGLVWALIYDFMQRRTDRSDYS